MEQTAGYRRSAAAVLLPILAFLSVFLTLPSFVWHLKNRNVAACSLIVWIILANIFVFINAIIWPTDDVAHWWSGVGLCDVEVKLAWAISVGACGSLTCIMRNLAKVMDVDRLSMVPSKAQRRRQMIVDVLWCYACPVYIIAVDYVCQAGRYYIFTISGCTPAVDNSWVTIVLIFIWAPILCLAGSYYCVLLVIRLYRYRRQFTQIVSSTNSQLNRSRFLRLFSIAVILLFLFLPVQFYILYVNVSYPHHAYDWNSLHGATWHDIIKVPTGGQVIFDRWIRVASGFLLFFFFGMGRDAMEMYRCWLIHLGLGRVCPSLTQPSTTSSSSSRLGSFSSQAKHLFRKVSFATTTMSSRSSRSNSEVNEIDAAPFTLRHANQTCAPARSASPIPPPPVDPEYWKPLTAVGPPRRSQSLEFSPGHAQSNEKQTTGVSTHVHGGGAKGETNSPILAAGGMRVKTEITQTTSRST
ncbi:MAG: hypothetical protein M1825_000986 [Sarcosagium campestre]|nr:MAG: hypothetical protein M1825_000986 [Sarcosagium campestre]